MAYVTTDAVLLLTVAFQTLSATISHSEVYQYYNTEVRKLCVPRSSRKCGWLDCWNTYRNECYDVSEQVLRQGIRCQTGWTSRDCTVPICKKPCIDGEICTAPDTCECVSTGGGCRSVMPTVPCDAHIGTPCPCPSGFSETNCLTRNQLTTVGIAIGNQLDLKTIGIIIACILGFLVMVSLIVIIVLLVRGCVFQQPMPRILRSAQQTIRNQFSRPQLKENIADDRNFQNNQRVYAQVAPKPNKLKPATNASKVAETCLYNEGEVYEDIRLSSAAEADSSGGLTLISSTRLTFGEKIANGHFAIIRIGQLAQGNETILVATKGLIHGYTYADAKLMADKIVFQSRVPPHVNVVKFIGQLEDANKTGPLMVLEHCEISLKDWLSRIESMDSDVLENMSIFTMNIANGVKHLHENQVIHKRLGARNVLLKKWYGGYVAKLIGFGPNREDKGAKQVSLPVKWLAPETLVSLKSGSTTYDKNSDAWSFGITVWEIYSEGKVPYSDLQSDKVKKLLTKEKRMVLTRPEACPIDLFQNVMAPCWNFTANKRPSFAEICSEIDTFRKGTGLEPLGYYTSNSPNSGTYSEAAEPIYEDTA